ncbi:MAG TPA: (4Fe-4S)-binding protein [Dehalococcoidia bacterium]|nr:(4Fe-4S)-binding protein [Dehalococcoidia bacterium]
MIISVASGKGGTGKTLVATSLALSLKERGRVQLLDCDVEEPNAHILLKPAFVGSEAVFIPVPKIDESKCTYCGECARICAYHAIAVVPRHVLTFPELCHGCGACSYLCPEKAILEEGRQTGIVEWGHSDGVEFVHGKLSVGEAMPSPVIRKVKEHANGGGIVIIDVPPGTSCPVVEAVRGSDFCLLVTEPTPFGLNDLVLAVGTVRELGIPCGVVLNRAGVGDNKVERYCHDENLTILLTIPLDVEIARLYSRGVTLVEGLPAWKMAFVRLFDRIGDIANERSGSAKR